MKPSFCLLITLFGLAGMGAGARSDEFRATVTVRPETSVANRSFTLAEIADVKARDATLAKSLGAVEIGMAPLPGLSRLITPDDIIVRLRMNKFNPKEIELVGPPRVRITRAGAEVESDAIVKAALESLDKELKAKGATAEPVAAPGKIMVSPGAIRLRAGAYRGHIEIGAVYVPVAIEVDGRPVRTIDVALRIKRMQTVVVARRQLEPKQELKADDITVTQAELPSGFGVPITDPLLVIGKRVTRRILEGAPLAADSVEAAPVLKPGQKVTIEVIVGGVKITAPGLTRQGGAPGDTIRVYSLETKKELTAKIMDAETVRVE